MQLEPGGLGTPTRFTQRSSPLESCNAAGGSAAPVGVSVRSQAAPRYAIAGKVRNATVLRNVCIGLLLEARRAVQPMGTALRTKAKHVPLVASRVARRHGQTRARGAAFEEPTK